MYIFYDFETSSRELLGQILTYSFIVTDTHLTPVDELTGMIRCNRTQYPEPDAILTNKLNIALLQEKGDPEYIAASKIFNFLLKYTKPTTKIKYPKATLVGFNANQFDLDFLRSLLIRYGYNPYFSGRLKNVDILHYAQTIAFMHPDTFPWTLTEGENGAYYSFRLETLASALNLLHTAQTHDARDDVLLTIACVKHLQDTYQYPFSTFTPVQLTPDFNQPFSIAKQKTRDFKHNPPKKFDFTFWLNISTNKNSIIACNLTRLLEQDIISNPSTEGWISCITNINFNKKWFHLEPLSKSEHALYTSLIPMIQTAPLIQAIQADSDAYFKLIKKEWDIEYQLYEMGFQRIDVLHTYIQRLLKTPTDYAELLDELLKKNETAKDTHMIRLFNRAYLNSHPNPNPAHYNRYFEPRYVTGTLLKDPVPHTLQEQFNRIQTLLNDKTCPDSDKILLEALHDYYTQTLHESGAAFKPTA